METSWPVTLRFNRGAGGRPTSADIMRLTQKLTGAARLVSDSESGAIILASLGVIAATQTDAVDRARAVIAAELPGMYAEVVGGARPGGW